MALAVASVGGSTGGRGRGSNPTNTSGSPEASSSVPSSAAISTGGGRAAFSVRIAVDVCAASVKRGMGPIASRPPASQTISSAWAAPVKPPATRSAAPKTPFPSPRATIRPSVEPIDSPIPTAMRRPPSTTNGRIPAGTLSSGSTRSGSERTASAPPPIAPRRPPTWGSAPDRNPSRIASTTRTMAMRSRGFTGGMVAQVARGGARTPRAAARGVAGRANRGPRAG